MVATGQRGGRARRARRPGAVRSRVGATLGRAGLVALAFVLPCGTALAQKPVISTVSIEVVVDGEVRRMWSGAELSAKQFTAPNLVGAYRPMINLMDALPFEQLGVPRERLVALVISGEGRVDLKGQALEHLGDLRLQIDKDKGSVWKLIPSTPEVNKTLARLIGKRRVIVQDVRRIELTTGPPPPPKS